MTTRFLSTVLAVFFLAVALNSSVSAQEANWQVLGKASGCVAYYDENSIMIRRNGQYATVWMKSSITPACRQFSDVKAQLVANKISVSEFDHLLSLIEIDCGNKQYRTLANVMRSREKRLLSVAEFPRADWEDIPAESILVKLTGGVCK